MYQALYRKYRPRTFGDVAGQEHITETLKSQVASGRLSHAYLFIGTRGTGKTTCAKILAKAVNCEHPVNGDPCGVCAACRGIDDGSVMDVVEIDAASNNSVDNVRELRDEAVFSPASVKKRVYIIDEVHMLSIAAFNALLKILEEPPEHLMFILATTELRKVPPTILSRCQRYSFRRISVPVLSARLNYIADKEGLDLRPDAAELLSRLADGSFRDGISLLDQCSGAPVIDTEAVISAMGLAGNRRVTELLTAIAGGETAHVLRLFDSLWQDGKDPAGLLGDLCTLMRDILLVAVAGGGGAELISGSYEPDALRDFAGRFTTARLINAMETIQSALSGLRESPSPRTAAELCLVSLCDPALTDGLPAIRDRLSRLEQQGVRPAALPIVETARQEPDIEPSPAQAEPPRDEPPAPEDEDRPPFDMDEPPVPEPPVPEPPVPEPAPIPAAPMERSAPVVPVAPTPPVPADDAPPLPPSGEVTWQDVAAAVKPTLPVGLRTLLDDPLQMTGELGQEELVIRIAAGFAASMLNKPDIIARFRDAACGLTGRSITARVAEMNSTEKLEKRNIDEIARFKGVTFKN